MIRDQRQDFIRWRFRIKYMDLKRKSSKMFKNEILWKSFHICTKWCICWNKCFIIHILCQLCKILSLILWKKFPSLQFPMWSKTIKVQSNNCFPWCGFIILSHLQSKWCKKHSYLHPPIPVCELLKLWLYHKTIRLYRSWDRQYVLALYPQPWITMHNWGNA